MSLTRFSVSLDESLMRGIIWHKAHGRWAHPRFTCLNQAVDAVHREPIRTSGRPSSCSFARRGPQALA